VVLAIDGNSLVHRSYHAQARTGAHTSDGQPAWAVRGLLTQLVAAVDRIRPSLVVIGFDDPETSLRRDTWPGYKAQRGDKLDTLVEQLARAAEVLRELGVAVVIPAGLEADDVLASTAQCCRARGASTVIMTSDRDAFALIDENTHVLRIINGGVDASPLMTADRLVLLLGIRPEQYRDFAALRGDASDNLAGVRGIGPRTAARLLQEFGTAAAAFDDVAAVRSRLGEGVAARLGAADARARFELNCAIMAMHVDLPIELDFAAGPGRLPLPSERVSSAFREHNLTWTVRDALRVLCDHDGEPVRPQPMPWSEPQPDGRSHGWSDGWGGASRRLPKLPPRKPAMAQLSLFD
jgi:5'-3' exonuclease